MGGQSESECIRRRNQFKGSIRERGILNQEIIWISIRFLRPHPSFCSAIHFNSSGKFLAFEEIASFFLSHNVLRVSVIFLDSFRSFYHGFSAIFCPQFASKSVSGKVYYDLVAARKHLNLESRVAICRIEQISPFPYDLVMAECLRYKGKQVVWAQEEHKNAGAWAFVQPRFNSLLTKLALFRVFSSLNFLMARNGGRGDGPRKRSDRKSSIFVGLLLNVRAIWRRVSRIFTSTNPLTIEMFSLECGRWMPVS